MSTTQRQVGIESLAYVPIVVDDLDEALEFYTETLGFELTQDEEFEIDGTTGRWVTIGLPGDNVQFSLRTDDEPYYDEDTNALMAARKGIETYYTFSTDDCEACVESLREAGVDITEEPVSYPWGTEAMFVDPTGNEYSLFEYAE